MRDKWKIQRHSLQVYRRIKIIGLRNKVTRMKISKHLIPTKLLFATEKTLKKDGKTYPH